MIANPAPAAPFQSASLYVGDLHNEVTESLLFELFNRVGPVASIRVCRDSVTRRSLGYAYVNFHNVQDAERALDTMNFTDIKGRPCRIMWSQRDPSLRKSGLGNVFVRNLAPSVDNKGLYDTFSVFGNILSCKVATDPETGASTGYGYVHFETAEAAQDAIQKFDGTLIDEVEVHVGLFVRRQDRADQADWTNLYVKHFPPTWDDAKLKEIFESYGALANVAVTMDAETNKSKGFGFVNFVEHESAKKALEELSNKTFEEGEGESKSSFELYVSRAQKKHERNREIKTKLDAMNQERASKYQGMNLYVKNIADTVTDEQFRETFAPFGTITSARIMKEGSGEAATSKGFGFICYSSPEEATRAVTELNGKSLGGKPLVVTLHQRKEHRKMHLQNTYAPQNMRGGMMPPGAMGPGGMGPGGMGGMPGMVPPFMNMYAPQMNMGPGGPQMGPGGPRGMPAYPYPAGGPMGGPGRGPMNPRNMAPYPGQQPPRPGFFPGMQQMNPNQQFMGQPAQQGGPAGGQGRRMQGQQGGPAAGPQGGPPRRGPPPQGGQAGAQPGGPRGPMGAPRPMGPGGNMAPMVPGYPNMNPQQMQQQQGMRPQQPGGVPGAPQQQQQQLKFSAQARNQQQSAPNGQPGGVPPGPGGMPNPQQQMAMMQMQMQQMNMQQQQPPQQQQQAPQQAGPGKLDFSDAALASADPQTQKNMIGEHLYPLIYTHQPEQAGKITGMLLEMDNGELLNLIESPDALMSKIEEALNVLRMHKPTAEE